VNTISFGIQASEELKRNLLGFAVERIDHTENEQYVMPGFKVFRSIIPFPKPDTSVSTWEHPIQSFVWDDFTGKEKHLYEYLFYPVKGQPKKLDRQEPIHIKVQTEPLYSDGPHDVFFNRGVASSQAYESRFGNRRPDDPRLSKEKQMEALQWLTRDLDEAIMKFIDQARPGDSLFGCFYEFHYLPVVQKLKDAIDRGVDVHLIIDAKINEYTDKDGVFHESFPREDNLRTLTMAGIPFDDNQYVMLRRANPNDIQHNKFMILVREGEPAEVWTGSTNISLGGFSGQTNVGHWVRDPQVAKQFMAYWKLLNTDPGSLAGWLRSEVLKATRALRNAVGALHDIPADVGLIQPGTTTIFSPRSGETVLDLYAQLVDSAKTCSCITLAFGINDFFKRVLLDNNQQGPLVFMLLEKKDVKNPRSKQPFMPLATANNVYQAWGSYIQDPVYQWARETSAKLLGLNTHVIYVHSKFLIRDPLGDDSFIVTGSANFSTASTNNNDENMLVIRGNQRAADIYFTEFNRLFNHYYYRSVLETIRDQINAASSQVPVVVKPQRFIGGSEANVFLKEIPDQWLSKYASGSFKAKRLELFTKMHGAVTL